MKWTRFPDTLPTFVAEMDFPLDPEVSAALHEAIDRQLVGYLPEPTKNEMRQATSEWLERHYDWRIPPGQVFATADVLSAYEAILRTMIPAGTPIIVPTPAYMPFISLTPILGYPVIEVPMVCSKEGRWSMDLETIGKELAQGAGLVVLCNPHNPLGLVCREDELLALAEVVDRYGGLVFSDEIHAPLTLGQHQHIPYASLNETTAAHTLTSISASKAWNIPGLKCAQLIVSSEAHLPKVRAAEFAVSHGAATVGVLATTAAYRSKSSWLEMARDYIEGSAGLVSEFAQESLPGSDVTPLEGTYIVWLDARSLKRGSHRSPAHYFGEVAGVSVTDGALCGAVGEGHIRMTIATPRPILREILERLAKHWKV